MIIIISWILIISKMLQAKLGLSPILWEDEWIHSPTGSGLAREHFI